MRSVLVCGWIVLAAACSPQRPPSPPTPSPTPIVRPLPAWPKQLAVSYLETRIKAWDDVAMARTRGGAHGCLTCHTTLPYLLAAPLLRTQPQPTAFEQEMLSYAEERVTTWGKLEAWYTVANTSRFWSANVFFDQATIADQSRGSEAVLLATILAFRDRELGALSTIAKTAFDNLWALQRKEGATAGSFPWIDMTLAPWEIADTTYWGAALASIATSTAPDRYSENPALRPNLTALDDYLRRGLQSGTLTLHNQTILLWAASLRGQILNPTERDAIRSALLARQQSDGSWRTTDFAGWPRRVGTSTQPVVLGWRVVTRPKVTTSVTTAPRPGITYVGDGYATGLAVIALVAGGHVDAPEVERAVAWLRKSQDPTTGTWPFGPSLSTMSDSPPPSSQMMTDASTGFAALALGAYERAITARSPASGRL